MATRNQLGLLVLGFALTAGTAQGQGRYERPDEMPRAEKRSHVPIPPADGDDIGSPAELLARRLQRARDLSEMEKLALDLLKNPEKYGLTPKDVEEIMRQASRMGPEEARTPEQLKDLVEQKKQELARQKPNVKP